MEKGVKIKKIVAGIAIVCVVLFVACACLWLVTAWENMEEFASFAGEDTALFLAIAEVESGFSVVATSQKGAMGLCQVMPTTAEWCAGKMGIEYSEDLLYIAEYNAKIAVFYLDYLFEKFEDFDLAVCAYNAGEGRVLQWSKDEDVYFDGEFVDIPFEETKSYLKKVKLSYAKYNFLLKLKSAL